jgi:hypothetical protein
LSIQMQRADLCVCRYVVFMTVIAAVAH